MKRILLDTNSYSLYIKGDHPLVKEVKEADKIAISSVSVGELYAGFHRGNQFKANEDILLSFLQNKYVETLPITEHTARIYGKIVSALHKAGKPIPTNDIWIAAHAIEFDSILVSYDKHFLEIEGLRLWERFH